MKTLAILLLTMVTAWGAPAQNTWEASRSIGGNPTDLASDPLGGFYLIRNGALIRYSQEGDSLFSWSDPLQGPVTTVDATNPLRLLLFIREFNQLVFLNNRLTPLSEPVSIQSLGITETLAAATARQGGFWILDAGTRRILRFTHQLTKVTESVPLTIGASPEGRPIRLVESGEFLWLLVPGESITRFDLFGNLLKTLPTRALSASPLPDGLLLTENGKISRLTLAAEAPEPVLQWSESPVLAASLALDHLWILTSGQALIFTR